MLMGNLKTVPVISISLMRQQTTQQESLEPPIRIVIRHHIYTTILFHRFAGKGYYFFIWS